MAIGAFQTGARSAVLALVGFLAFVVGACSQSSSPSAQRKAITVEFWHSMAGEKGQLLRNIVERFNGLAENQGKIFVEMQFVGTYEEGLNKLRTALLAGKGPNVVQITDIGTQVMIDSNSIRPLQDFIDKDPEFPINRFLPAIRHYYEVNGRLYSLPFATSNPVIYYDADAFKKAGIDHPPATFAELEDDARKLTDKATKTYGLTWPLDSWFVEQFIARQGANFVEPANGRKGSRASQANLSSPEARAYLSMWARMVKEGTFANVGRGWDPAEQNFLAGRAKMLITSTSDIFEVMKQVPFKLGTAPIPGAKLARTGGTIVGGNALWIMKRKSPDEEQAAYKLIKFMSGRETQETWHTNTGYFPIREDVIDGLKSKGFYDKYPAAWTAIQQMRESPDTPATRGALMGVFPEAREYVMTAVEEILSGRKDLDAALRSAKSKIDFSLKRYSRGKAKPPGAD